MVCTSNCLKLEPLYLAMLPWINVQGIPPVPEIRQEGFPLSNALGLKLLWPIVNFSYSFDFLVLLSLCDLLVAGSQDPI